MKLTEMLVGGEAGMSQPSRMADSKLVPPEAGKLNVFISYSRDDLDFADQLVAALKPCGFDPTIDRLGISAGEAWKRRLVSLIHDSDTIVFVLSPASAKSDICAWEVEEAARLSKRILPVVCRPIDGASVPPRLQDLNYIFFYREPKTPGSGFGAGLEALVAALNTDLHWIRQHTRLLVRATEWDQGGRADNQLLSGTDISEAKDWAARRPKGAPEPTALQLDFIRASEASEAARFSSERKRLEEREALVKAAEEAQSERARIQRRNSRLILAAGALALALLAGAIWQSRDTESRELSVMTSLADQASLAGLHDKAMRITLQALPQPGEMPWSLGWNNTAVRGLEAKLAGAAMLSRHVARMQHEGFVRSASFSPDGARIVTASEDNTARVWDAASGKQIAALKGHEDRVVSAGFSPDGARIVFERQYRERRTSRRLHANGGLRNVVGVDWASETHHVRLSDAKGRKVGERAFAHGGQGLAEMVAWILKLTGATPDAVFVAIEVPHGPVVESLMERGFRVHAINPKQLDPTARRGSHPRRRPGLADPQHGVGLADFSQLYRSDAMASAALVEVAEPLACFGEICGTFRRGRIAERGGEAAWLPQHRQNEGASRISAIGHSQNEVT